MTKHSNIHCRLFAGLWLTLAALCLLGCQKPAPPVDKETVAKTTTDIPEKTVEAKTLSLQDFDQMVKNKKLRLLILPWEDNALLPRKGLPTAHYRRLIEGFAEKHELEIEWVVKQNFDHLIPALIRGEGDIIARNMTVTPEREVVASFSSSLFKIQEMVVGTAQSPALKNLNALSKYDVAVRKDTSHESTIRNLSKHHQLQYKVLSGDTEPVHYYDNIAKGNYLGIVDSNVLEALKSYRRDIKPVLALEGYKSIAWMVRHTNPKLLKALNSYLLEAKIASKSTDVSTGDWKTIEQRRSIRMLTRNSADTYFMWRGELMGFEYDLAQAFAKEHKLALEVVVPEPGTDLHAELLAGNADFIAAGWTITEARKTKGYTFTRPTNYVDEVLVARENESFESISDLKGRAISVRPDSAFWTTLMAIKNQHKVNFELLPASSEHTTEELIQDVVRNKLDLTMADSTLLNIEQTYGTPVKTGLVIAKDVPHGWVVRPDNPELLKKLNRFIRKKYRGVFYNVTKDKYFHNSKHIKAHLSERISENSALSPYDELVKKNAKAFEFDWRLIVSQMYQESRFDPNAVSHAGAMGLMQVMPRTGKKMGYTRLKKPDIGVRAGVQYMDWVRDRFDDNLPLQEQLWMTLAAYNAGVGHVRDARHLAAKQGLDPNKWFNNVEKAILLLSKPKYHRKARFGYVRGREPVKYVREISERFNGYVQLGH